MISELFEMIGGLQGESYFFVEDGPLKDKLIERYLDTADAHADIHEFSHDASLRIRREEGTAAPSVEGRLEAGDFQYQTRFSMEDFSADEISALIEQLKPLCPTRKHEARPSRNIIRKKKGGGLLNLSEASKALGLSPRTLKSLIPCSDIRVREDGDNRTIEEYYWEMNLVRRFVGLWEKHKAAHEADREDVTLIAERCCDGDRQWARDIIAGFLKQRTFSDN